MELLIFKVLLVILISAPSIILCQLDVEARGVPNDKVNSEVSGGGQARTIYSQRHISPHRMMHFGKRPAIEEPPRILTPQGYDLNQPGNYPYLFHIELERGQTLRALPEDPQTTKNLMYTFEYPQVGLVNSSPQYLHQQFLPQLANNGQKFSKLIAAGNDDNGIGDTDNNNSNNNDNDEQSIFNSPERAQPSSNTLEDNQQQQQLQQQQQQQMLQNSNIKLNTRSPSMQSSARGNSINLPKNFISSILFGRSNSATIPNFATFNKKAEPKDNFFMHFGRK